MAKVTVPQTIPADLGTTKVNTKPVKPDDSVQHTADQINKQNEYLIQQANEHNANDDRITANAAAVQSAQSNAAAANIAAAAAQATANANAGEIASLLTRVADLEQDPLPGDARVSIAWSDATGGSATLFSERMPESDGVFSQIKLGTVTGGSLAQGGQLIAGTHYNLTGTVPAGLQATVTAVTLNVFWVRLQGVAASHAAGLQTDIFAIEILDGGVAGDVKAPNNGEQMRDFSIQTFDTPAPGQSFFDPLAITSAVANPDNATSGLGMNTDFISDSSTSFPFKNLMKQSRTPISGSNNPFVWDNGQQINEDSDGWPTSLGASQVVRYLFLWDTPALTFPGGTYRVEWEGTGTVSITGADSIGSTGANFIEFDISNASQAQLRCDLTATTPGDPVRNIAIIAPDPATGLVAYAAAGPENHVTQPFYPAWLEKMAIYKTIRFMDFLETNFSDLSTWQDRARKSHRSYTDRGAPLEVVCEVGNKLSADIWVNFPARATDDYVTKACESIKADLDASLKVHLELCNEVWNGQFNNIFDEDGQVVDTLAAYFGQFDPTGTDKQRGYAERSRQIMEIATTIFAGTGRLTRWLGTQGANPGITSNMLAVSGVAAAHDCIGVAPYAGVAVSPAELAAFPQIETWTGAQWLSEIQTGALGQADTIADVMGWPASQEQHAIPADLRIGCYEFGYNLVGHIGGENNANLNIGLDECYRLPGWYQEVLNYWDAYIARTYDTDKVYTTACWYYLATRLNKFSRFGAMESTLQTEGDADRWRAMKDWRVTNPNQPPAAPSAP